MLTYTMPLATRSRRAPADVSSNVRPEPSTKKRKLHEETSETSDFSVPVGRSSKRKTAKADPEADLRTFLCLCHDAVRHNCRVSPTCMCLRYLDNNPKHPYSMTKKGGELYMQWRTQQVKRDAELLGVTAYKYFSGYGTAEVVENMVDLLVGVFGKFADGSSS